MNGFSFAERWGRWSAAERSGFSVCFEEAPISPVTLAVEGRVYLSRPGQRQRVSARVNGRKAFEAEYRYDRPSDRETLEWRFTLAPTDLDPEGCAALEFETPDAAPAPATWRDAPARRLGVGISAMRVIGALEGGDEHARL